MFSPALPFSNQNFLLGYYIYRFFFCKYNKKYLNFIDFL